ncbi:MAG: translation initiation factor IF-3 [Planctomycetota bacterium]
MISENGDQIGVFPVAEAMRMAHDAELDLVEVAADARPPVCRILDFGKYKYEQKKKSREHKKPTNKLKGMRLRPKTDVGDLTYKTNRARTFLEEGDTVQFTVIFRGRELARTDLGTDLLKRVALMLDDVAKIQKPAHMEGRRMHMILAKR